jgi:peptidyl-prolyl cis-trans isomerase A (cyclophilin A)
LFLLAFPAARAAKKPEAVRVLIETEKGTIEVELATRKAPLTAANFLKYVDGKFYDGGRFHRTVTRTNQPKDKVRIEVIQARINPRREKDSLAAIKLERTNKTGMAHKNGTISMARDGPDTATSDFFICIGDQPALDFGGNRNPDGQGFAAFGRVVKGMDVVKKIQAAPAKGQALTPPVKILKIRRKPVASSRGQSRADARPRQEYEQWMKDVVSPNKPPPIKGGPPEAHFPRDYDFRAQHKILQTWNRLNAELEHALPVLLKHLNDGEYSLTIQNGKGCDYDYTVRGLCKHIISKHMGVWKFWVVAKPKLVADHLPLGPLIDWQGKEFGSFDWLAEVKKTPKDRDPSLFALQVKAFEWAIRRQQDLPARDKNQQDIVLECLRQRRDELVRSGRPIRCSPWGGFHFQDFHIRGRFHREERTERRTLAKAMRAEVSRLASPNRPPKIVKGKVVHFPKGYNQAAQERVVRAIGTLNKNIEDALPTLVAGVKDKRYCVTLEGSEGAQRNVTVGKLCCLLLAANVNAYRPYVRSLDESGSYPMYLRPTPSSVAKRWKRWKGKSLATIQSCGAFKWALKFETERDDFPDKHERDVRLTYLKRRYSESNWCRVPIVVDMLKSERVVLPKHTNPKR